MECAIIIVIIVVVVFVFGVSYSFVNRDHSQGFMRWKRACCVLIVVRVCCLPSLLIASVSRAAEADTVIVKIRSRKRVLLCKRECVCVCVRSGAPSLLPGETCETKRVKKEGEEERHRMPKLLVSLEGLSRERTLKSRLLSFFRFTASPLFSRHRLSTFHSRNRLIRVLLA